MSEALAQYHLSPESKFENGRFWDRGRTERRHIVATEFVLIGEEANRVGESGESDPIVASCTFAGNFGGRGCGMYNVVSNPTVSDCLFVGNMATVSGGGVFNGLGSSPLIIGCTFEANIASGDGHAHGGGVR